ncbi:uncharacterized protein LOC141674442 [Apium graveolens]|uniref:uncharacterized protein LOC141674442 n=1 Tax=Apium graveolens TaxID=4045 RepID=UPI003D79C7EE
MREFHKLGNVVKWPVKSNKPKANPDSKLWCDFHGYYGHRAHDCVALRREIQTLIKKGNLSEFTKHSTHDRREQTPARQPPPPPHHKVISFIAGWSDVCGATYSQAKRIARDANLHVTQANVQVNNITRVYFDEQDKGTKREPQYDSLVISIPIENCLIKRVLVDNGSAENIMMLTTLKQMGLAESDMLKRTTTLVGFSGETKRTMGEIALPIYAQGVNLLQKFVIIDYDSTYNIIHGRPWIHDLKVIPSTYHQVIKFSTPWGVQEIHGDQATARECYKTCLKSSIIREESKKPVIAVSGPEKLVEVDLSTGDKRVLMGEDLSPTIESNLVDFLTSRLDDFAWEHERK